MKKFFTLIAAVAMAASMNAQGTYAVQIGDKIAAGQQVTSVDNVTLTFNENAGASFSDGKETPNWAEKDFVAYTAGKNNGKLVKEAEPTGCVYKFETTKAGSLTVGIQLSANKGLHILNAAFEEVALDSYNLPAKAGDASQTLTTNDKDETIIPADGTKSNGTITFKVEYKGTYYVLAAGTKLGFFGFKYAVGGGDATGISTVEAASAKQGKTYNVAGQEVSASYKGLVIKNGKKYVK